MYVDAGACLYDISQSSFIENGGQDGAALFYKGGGANCTGKGASVEGSYTTLGAMTVTNCTFTKVRQQLLLPLLLL